MTENCFDVLGIDPTKDENIIKKAYRRLLHTVNPEDDAKGFQRLRSAYEEACRYARKQERPHRKRASEQFVEQCEALYDDFFRRICPSEWETLFADPVCVSLETEEEVRRAFLTFLMEHFHLPDAVWQCVDRTFDICGSRRTLREWLPEDFVDYLCQAVRGEGLINYALFQEGAGESAKYDAYIDLYCQLRQFTDLGLMEQARDRLRQLKETGVYHPYAEIEEARILLYEEQKEEAGEIFIRLGNQYPMEERIACCYGQFLQMEDRWEEVGDLYGRLLRSHPDSLLAGTGRAEQMLHAGEYRQAREEILDLLEHSPQDERLMKDLTDANLFMIEELCTLREIRTLTQDEEMDLGWCYYQNMRFDEALAVLDALEPDEDHLLDYHNLKGRVYMTLDRNEEALIHLEPWLSELLRIRPDGTKKTKRRLARLGYACYMVGSAKAAILLAEEKSGGRKAAGQAANALPEAAGKNAEVLAEATGQAGTFADQEAYDAAFAEAMEYFDRAIAVETEESQIVSYYHTMADIYRRRKDFGRVMDACDQMLLRNPGYYPAVLLRQEAALALGMYQQTMDDYQRAVHMYPYYGRPYATLIKMYFLFGEYDKAGEVLKDTEDKKIESDALVLLTARYRAITAKSRDDLKESLRMLDDLKGKGWKYTSDLDEKEWTEIDYRRGLILTDLGRLSEARKAMEDSLAAGGDDVSRLFGYAAILMQMEEYDQAISWFLKALTYVPDDVGILYRIGWCYKLKGEYEEALSYMKKVLELDAGHQGVRMVIVELYERLARRKEDNAYYHLALPYMQEQVKMYPEEYYRMEMGLLYLDMDAYEKALALFEQIIDENPESVFAYNNAGSCYLSMDRPEKAEPLFCKAAELMKNEITPLPYNNLAKCYRMMGNYKKALACYEKNRKLFPDDADIYLLLGDLYRENEQYARAVATYEEGMSKTEHPAPLEMEMFRTYGMKGDYDRAVSLLGRLRKKYPKDPVLYQLAGEVYLFGFRRGREAAGYLLEALRLCGQDENMECFRGSLYLLGRCRLFLGEEEEARRCFKEYITACRGEDGCSRRYEEFYGERGRRKYRIGCAWFFLGRWEEAKQCFREMHTQDCRCDGCVRTCCYEMLLAEAMVLLARGEVFLAAEKYNMAAEQVPDDMEHRFEADQLREKIREESS